MPSAKKTSRETAPSLIRTSFLTTIAASICTTASSFSPPFGTAFHYPHSSALVCPRQTFGTLSPTLPSLTPHKQLPQTNRIPTRLHESPPTFSSGDKIQVEISYFGKLGASVDIVGTSHTANDVIPEDEPAYAHGLILQREISYFRQGRDNVDVLVGEILPAYVEKVLENGKLNVSLRPVGYQKSENLAEEIMARLKLIDGGVLGVGDKSSPGDIGMEFPGQSKGSFKKAVASLYKKGLVKPGPDSVTLL